MNATPEALTTTSTPSDDGQQGSTIRNRTYLWWIAGALVVALVVAVAIAVAGGSDESSASGGPPELTIVEVARRDLIARDTFGGTLGFGDELTVFTRSSTSSTGAGGAGTSSGSGSSTLTAIAPEGEFVEQGRVVFRVDQEPVVLVAGTTPAYRTLSTSSDDGRDIAQLEAALTSLGYDPGTVDEAFTASTASAVEQWETDLGRADPDGVVSLGEVVFGPAPARVGAHRANVGDIVSTGTPILGITGTTRVVTIELDARRQDLVAAGDAVRVTFSDGGAVDGTVASVGRVATSTSSQTGVESGDPTITVTITLPDDPAVPDLDQAPVTVGISREQRENALTVPVTALLALVEGGYGLEVVQPSGTTRIVAVEVGVYADGYVEVAGQGIEPGTKVLDP